MDNKDIFSIDEINEESKNDEFEENSISNKFLIDFKNHMKNLNFEFSTKLNSYLDNLRNNLNNIEIELINYYEKKMIDSFKENKQLDILFNESKIKNEEYKIIIKEQNSLINKLKLKNKINENFKWKQKFYKLRYFYFINKKSLISKYEKKSNNEIYKVSKLFNESVSKINKINFKNIIELPLKSDYNEFNNN